MGMAPAAAKVNALLTIADEQWNFILMKLRTLNLVKCNQ
jgi:hypothetical protein